MNEWLVTMTIVSELSLIWPRASFSK